MLGDLYGPRFDRMGLPGPTRQTAGGMRYHIEQASPAGGTIGSPSLQSSAFRNSGMFTTVPFTRNGGTECEWHMVKYRGGTWTSCVG